VKLDWSKTVLEYDWTGIKLEWSLTGFEYSWTGLKCIALYYAALKLD